MAENAWLRFWVEVEGKTQREIAEMVGVSHVAIGKRARRLGLQAKDNRGGDRTLVTGYQSDAVPGETTHTPEGYWDEPEEVDGEHRVTSSPVPEVVLKLGTTQIGPPLKEENPPADPLLNLQRVGVNV